MTPLGFQKGRVTYQQGSTCDNENDVEGMAGHCTTVTQARACRTTARRYSKWHVRGLSIFQFQYTLLIYFLILVFHLHTGIVCRKAQD